MESLKKIVDLKAPTFVDTTRVMTLGGVDLYMWDVVKTALASRLNIGLGGGAGGGKSQLLSDVRGLFGNDDNYVLGRNDLDIKQLFRELKFSKLKEAMDSGKDMSQKDISSVTSQIYKPLTIIEEINRCAEIVQNQLFNIFEGFIELDGTKYTLGHSTKMNFKGLDGKEFTKDISYSVGLWSANFGNGSYTGTVTMDKALKERSHLIIDMDNFYPGRENPSDLDKILLGSGGEIRLKDTQNSKTVLDNFTDAYKDLMQSSYTPKLEGGKEVLIYRYLVNGLDYIPSENAGNSKRMMKEAWPGAVDENLAGFGDNDDDKLLYRTVFPSSIRGGLTIMSLARGLRAYAKAKNPEANPSVIDSVAESFKLVAPYSGMLENKAVIRENHAGNNYLAGVKVSEIIKNKLVEKEDLMDAIIHHNASGKAYSNDMLNECTKEFECFK